MKTASVAALVLATTLSARPQQDKTEQAQKDLINLGAAVEVFKLRTGNYPDTLKNLPKRNRILPRPDWLRKGC
jgi:Type II secretion system (T2SS), protein G